MGRKRYIKLNEDQSRSIHEIMDEKELSFLDVGKKLFGSRSEGSQNTVTNRKINGRLGVSSIEGKKLYEILGGGENIAFLLDLRESAEGNVSVETDVSWTRLYDTYSSLLKEAYLGSEYSARAEIISTLESLTEDYRTT